MIHQLRTLVIKELLSYLRDPRSRFILIGPPLIQLLIFSYAATMEVNNVRIGVMNEDKGSWSRNFVARVAAANFVADVVYETDPAQLQRNINNRNILLGIHIEETFSHHLTRGELAEVQVLIDGRRANAGQIAARYLDSITAELNRDIQAVQRATVPQVASRAWFNQNLTYQWFIVPSLAGTLSMMIALLITALSIARERELGTFDQLLMTPTSPFTLIIGKTIPAMIIGMGLGCVMIFAGIFLFKIPFRGSYLLLFISLGLFNLSVVGLGLTISSFCKTQQQAILGTFAITIPVILISGFATPVENMPSWLQVISQASPLRHFLVIVQGSFLKALPTDVVVINAWPMAVIALVTLTTATVIVRWRLH